MGGVELLLDRFGDQQLGAKLFGGLFDTRRKGYNDRIRDITEQREQLARKLERTEERLTKQFSSLDNLLGKMRSTGEFLGRQLSSLPGAQGNSGNGQ